MTKLPFFPTFGKAVKESLLELYNSMSFSVLVSLIWFIGYLPIFFLIGPLISMGKILSLKEQFSVIVISLLGISFWNGLVTGPFTTTIYGLYQVKKIDYPNLRTFFQIFKQVYWRSARIHWAFSATITILTLNLMIAMINWGNILLIIPGILSVYVLFLLLLALFYFHPLIYLDNSFKKVVKKSFLLVLDNMGLSIWFSGLLGLLFLVSIVFVPLLLIYGAFVVYLTSNGFEPIYQKYE